MTAVGAPQLAVAYDMLLAFGLSVAVWFFYHWMCLLTPAKKPVLAMLLHLMFFAAAGLICFCFIVGETVSRQPRWHMALGFGLGAWIYYGWFARYAERTLRFFARLLWLAVSPFVKLWAFLRRAVFDPAAVYLQKKRAVLYNKKMEARRKKDRKRRRKDAVSQVEQPEQKKEPVKAYSQS